MATCQYRCLSLKLWRYHCSTQSSLLLFSFLVLPKPVKHCGAGISPIYNLLPDILSLLLLSCPAYACETPWCRAPAIFLTCCQTCCLCCSCPVLPKPATHCGAGDQPHLQPAARHAVQPVQRGQPASGAVPGHHAPPARLHCQGEAGGLPPGEALPALCSHPGKHALPAHAPCSP